MSTYGQPECESGHIPAGAPTAASREIQASPLAASSRPLGTRTRRLLARDRLPFSLLHRWQSNSAAATAPVDTRAATNLRSRHRTGPDALGHADGIRPNVRCVQPPRTPSTSAKVGGRFGVVSATARPRGERPGELAGGPCIEATTERPEPPTRALRVSDPAALRPAWSPVILRGIGPAAAHRGAMSRSGAGPSHVSREEGGGAHDTVGRSSSA